MGPAPSAVRALFTPVPLPSLLKLVAPGIADDARLRVHGIGGLRIVDASVFPTLTSGNTNAPTVMVAEKGADMIRADARGDAPA